MITRLAPVFTEINFDEIKELLKPLRNDTSSYQSYLCTGLHTLGLLGWILEQTGRADVYVSTFSTSDAFLSGFLRLKKST